MQHLLGYIRNRRILRALAMSRRAPVSSPVHARYVTNDEQVSSVPACSGAGSYNVRKVSSGFEYFLLTFACRLGITLSRLGIDAEFDSLSNGVTFMGSRRTKKGGFGRNTRFFDRFSV